MSNIITKIWKDPVWSKVIAAGIIAISVWLSGFYKTLYGWFLIVLLHIWSNIFLYLFIISILVIIHLLRRLNKTKNASIPQKKPSSNWFITFYDDSFYKYLFLLWFPLHRTLQSEKFFYDEKFDHIPEFYELYMHNVIFNKNVGAVEYVIVISKEVYDYLDEFYQREKDKFDSDMNKFIYMLRNVSFYELCRRRK